jgi:hypothetical protein
MVKTKLTSAIHLQAKVFFSHNPAIRLPSIQLLREEGRTSSLPSSFPPPFSMNIFAFVAFSLKVSLALFTSHEVLSIISYDLSHPAMKPQGLGFSTTLVSSSSMFAGFSPPVGDQFQSS